MSALKNNNYFSSLLPAYSRTRPEICAIERRAFSGCGLDGLAADFAVRLQDQHTLLAMDTVSHLYQAFRFRAEDPGGYVWLQGIAGMWKELE